MAPTCNKLLTSFTVVFAALILFQTAAFAIGPSYSGSWFNPEQDGHGFSLEYVILNDGTPLVVAYWYVYDSEGNPIFLVGQGEVGESDSVELDFIAPHGMKFGEFLPSQISQEDGGSGTFTFENDESGVFVYEPSSWMVNTYDVSPISIPVVKIIGVALKKYPTSGSYVTDYVGAWTGRMTYDRTSHGTCYDADIELDVMGGPFGNLPYQWGFYATAFRDGGGISVYNNRSVYIRDSGLAAGTVWFFSNPIDVNFRFPPLNSHGHAEGYWSYQNGECYGEWAATKQ